MAQKASRLTSVGARRTSRARGSPVPAPPAPAIARNAFPIAVIGASAGGLDAFRRLLRALPAKSGLGFVLVPHLDPARDSRMVGLLTAASAMPVEEARGGRPIRPNHVYVIPPNRLLTLHQGRLALAPLPDPRAGATALDVALRSLAEDQGAHAVAIVLSGTGSYGAAGVREVLKAGGLVLAQDPVTAQYDQMPRSAAAAGVPRGHILAPESMAPVLLAHAAERTGPGVAPSGAARFFRESGALDALVVEALPGLIERASEALPVRVWVPECGAGEEAYSVAILLLERLRAAGKGAALKVFATDSDAESLRAARRGIYPVAVIGAVSSDRLARFFTRLPTGEYQVSGELRRAVVFGQVDLLTDPPISRLDLLVWRAPLSDRRPEERARLIGRLHFALSPGGYLLLGPEAGPAAEASGWFETVSAKAGLYRKRALPAPAAVRQPAAARDGAQEPRALAAAPLENITAFLDHALLERLAPAAILMNTRYRILATRGPVTRYLKIAPRMPLPSLLTAAGASLRAATHAACEEALRNNRWARHRGSWTRRDGRLRRCNISARSLRSRSGKEPLLLVIFEDDGSGTRAHPHSRREAARKTRADLGLEGPRESSRSNLPEVLADLERAQDDLEASHEQMSAMNEELRMANEELQSSNEEMLAMNEELESSKASLQQRIEASERVEAQLRAVLDATVDAVVTIKADGNILTFNGSASRMFGYALQEVIGQNVSILLPPEMRALHDEYLARYRKTRERHIIGTSREVIAYRRNGTRFPALLSVSETTDADLLVGCLRDLSPDKTLQEEILHIAALEQQRIGQELHDGTQQELTGLGLLAQNLCDALDQAPGPAHAELARRLAAGIAEANRHVRSLARGLVPAPVDAATLPAALAELARGMQQAYGLACRLECPASLRLPDATTATHLYRIAQEAAGNAAKHGKADEVLIRLARDDQRLRLEIHDNGIGIPPQPAMNGGVGLRLMEHRCTVLGGRFAVGPRSGGGTVVSCTVPLPGKP